MTWLGRYFAQFFRLQAHNTLDSIIRAYRFYRYLLSIVAPSEGPMRPIQTEERTVLKVRVDLDTGDVSAENVDPRPSP